MTQPDWYTPTTIALGYFAIFYGIISLGYVAANFKNIGSPTLAILESVISLALGYFILKHPSFNAVTIPFIIAFWAMVSLAAKWRSKIDGKKILTNNQYIILLGILFIALAVYAYVTQADDKTTMMLLLGIELMSLGILNMKAAIYLRK